MRRGVAVAGGIGMLALAYLVTATTPGQPVQEAPFATPAVVGEPATSRTLVVTAHEIVLADEVEVGGWRGTTSGVWLAGELTTEAIAQTSFSSLDVFVDGVRYTATRRMSGATVIQASTAPGFPVTGPFAVELPAGILEQPGARAAVLRIGEGLDARLDSVVELTVDLTTLERVDRYEAEPVRDGAR